MFKKAFVFVSLVVSMTCVEAKVNKMFAEEIAENKKYNNTIRAFMAQSQRMTDLVHKSYAHVVFPTIGKGAAVLGYATGEGRAYIRGGIWTGNVSVSQYTVGLQVGGSAYSQIIFFKTRDAFERFKLGEIEDSTQASLVPIYSGISGDVNFDDGVEVYTSNKGGLLLDLSTGTQVFEYIQKP